MEGKILAPGYVQAKIDGDYTVIDSYRMARFVGAQVPHIDPLKEVKAERAKLGSNADHLPLTTAEAATESLNSGEYEVNAVKFSSELETASELNIEPVTSDPSSDDGDSGGNDSD